MMIMHIGLEEGKAKERKEGWCVDGREKGHTSTNCS